MITAHLTDMELQLYITEPEMISDLLAAHIKTCAHCQSRAANYSLLFKGLENSAQPAFDFDLASQVMAVLPAKKTSYGWLPGVLGGFGSLLVLLAISVSGKRLTLLFSSLPSSLLWVLVIPAVVLLVMQVIAVTNDHYRKMTLLINS